VHAVLVSVKIHDYDHARQELHDDVVPRVKQAPGLVAGYWFAPAGDQGWSTVLFESEEAAQAAAEQVRAASPQHVTIQNVDVREVIESA
jgi:hypothetical protein